MPTPKQSRHGGSSPRSCSSCGNAIPESFLTDLCLPCQRAIRKRNADPNNFEGQWWKWNSTFYARVHMASGHLDVYSIRDTRAKCLAIHRSLGNIQQEGRRVKKITTLPACRKADPYTEQAELAAVNTLIEPVAGYCRAAVIDRWSVRCISPFRQASDLGCNRSWAEPINPERAIHHSVRLHLAKEEPWMKWNS